MISNDIALRSYYNRDGVYEFKSLIDLKGVLLKFGRADKINTERENIDDLNVRLFKQIDVLRRGRC